MRAAGAGFARGVAIQAAEAARTGTGLIALGESFGAAAKQLEASRLKRQAAADKLAMAQAKSKFLISDITSRNSFEGDPDFATYESRYLELATEACESGAEGLRDELKGLFTASCEVDIARGRVEVAGKARKQEVDAGAADIERLMAENLQSALEAQDEASRAGLLNATNAALDAARSQGFITDVQTQAKREAFATEFASARFKILPPEQRLEALQAGMTRSESGQPIFQKTGTILDRVPIDERVEMITKAQKEIVAIRREDRLAAKRAQDEQDRALKLAREETADEFTRRLYDPETPPLTYRDILDSNLEATQQQVYLNVLDKDGKTGQTNEAFYNEVFENIGDGRITFDQLSEVVLPFLGKGITGQDYTRLRTFAKSVQGEETGQALKGFLAMSKAQITKSNLFTNDPAGDRLFFEFTARLTRRIEEERAKGVPLADLLNPDSPSYLGSMINDYVRSPRQQIQDKARQLRGEPPVQ